MFRRSSESADRVTGHDGFGSSSSVTTYRCRLRVRLRKRKNQSTSIAIEPASVIHTLSTSIVLAPARTRSIDVVTIKLCERTFERFSMLRH
jgi:hypothetical protein